MSQFADLDRLFHLVLDPSVEAVLIVEPDQDAVVNANQSAQRLLLCSGPALKARPLSETVVDARELFVPSSRFRDGWSGSLTFWAWDRRTVLTEAGVLLVEVASVSFLVIVARPIVDPSVLAERQISSELRFSRLAAMVELMALADQLNQPLTAILLNVRAIERSAARSLPKWLREALADIAHDSQRAGHTLRNLLRLLREK